MKIETWSAERLSPLRTRAEEAREGTAEDGCCPAAMGVPHSHSGEFCR